MLRTTLSKSLSGTVSRSYLSNRSHLLQQCKQRRTLYVTTNFRYKETYKPSYYHAASSTQLLHKTIGDVLNETTERYRDKEFVIFSKDNTRRTFGDFKDEVDRLALGLVHLGVRRGDRVGIWGPNTLEWLRTQYAVASLGAILVHLNPACRQAELEHAMSVAGVKVLMSASTFKTQDYYGMVASICPHITSASPGKLQNQRLPNLESVILYGGDPRPGTYSLDDVMSMGSDDDRRTMDTCRDSVQFDDPSNIVFTSGTTGLPKGATLTHHNTVNHAYFQGKRVGFEEPGHVMCAPPPFVHVFGTNIVSVPCMMYGITLVVPAPSFEAAATIKAINKEKFVGLQIFIPKGSHKCTSLYGTPTMFIAVLNHDTIKQYDVTSVKSIFCAGAAIPSELLKLAQSTMGVEEVMVGYGLTESTAISTVSCKEDTMEQRLNTVGRLQDHLEMKVIDPETKALVPMGTAGELCIRGWQLMKEYWGQKDKTREAIDENGWFQTGDIGTIDDQGYCTIESRLKDLIIRGGANIYPAEVENLIHTHPHVQEVQVIGVPDELMGEEVCAVVIRKPGTETTEQDIREFCRGKISHYKIPRYVRFVEEFPMTVSGKIQKFKLRELVKDSLNSK